MKKKIGLPSVVATGVGVVVATSCLLTVGQGAGMLGSGFIIAMIIGFVINSFFVSSVSELNALMPNLTGGLAQYTLSCYGRFVTIVIISGGYLIGNAIVASVECAMFGNAITSIFPDCRLPSNFYSIVMIVILMLVNYKGIDIFAKVQNVVAYGLIISVTIMGLIGIFKLGSGDIVQQPFIINNNINSILSLSGMAFFLFIASEFIIPISSQIENPKRNVPRGMILSLLVILIMQIILILGFKNYTLWEDLVKSTNPHVLYGANLLGNLGVVWMTVVTIFAVVSTVNSNISGLSYLAQGMAKIDLLPNCLDKVNKNKAPYISITLFGIFMIAINLVDLSSASQIMFLVLCACLFTMLAYILVHLNVIILRKKLPKAPRTYKSPFGISLQVLGVIGVLWMMWNIDPSIEVKLKLYGLTAIVIGFISIYAFIWLKFIIKKPFFKALEIKEVLAMENEMYRQVRESKKVNSK